VNAGVGRALALAALGVLALHAFVDAFLAPEPGTDWSDHLGRGAATLAILVAASVVVVAARPGARAAVAAVLGGLALEGAALAVAGARATQPRGEDWTGFALAPVGVVLIGLAAVELWRTRRPGGHRWLRRGAVVLVAAVAVLWVVIPIGVAIGVTHRPRDQVGELDLGRPYRDVSLRTADGLRLAAAYVPSRNGAAVVSFPTRGGKQAQARMLARHGYGVLLVDMRGYDGSEGDANALGWGAAKDIDAAVDWLRRRPDVQDGRIGGIGFSVGGEQMLEAAARNSGLRAVVSEGAGERSVRETALRGSRAALALPTALVQTGALAVLSGEPPPLSLETLVRRIAPRAVLLIEAGRGAGGEELNEDYFRAARQPKEYWRIPESGHVGGYAARPAEYELRVVGFFHRTLLRDAPAVPAT
jgi:hypothetical protein